MLFIKDILLYHLFHEQEKKILEEVKKLLQVMKNIKYFIYIIYLVLI